MPRKNAFDLYILAFLIISSIALVQYDKIINQRLERIDPELLQELQTAKSTAILPVILSVHDTTGLPERIGKARITVLNPYTHSKGYNALIATELKVYQIRSLIKSGAIDAIQKETTIQALPTTTNPNPDRFEDFTEFKTLGITGGDIVVLKLDSGARTGWSYLETHTAFEGDDGVDRDGHGGKTEAVLRTGCTNCQIISIKILDNNGRGSFGSVIRGLDIAEEIADRQQVDYLYGSFGSSGISGVITSVFASQLALNHQIVSFYASGNEGRESLYTPSSAKYVWDVRAVDNENIITSFSNYGEKNSFLSISDYGFYASNAGTSFSAPRIAAKMALMDSHYRSQGVFLSFNQKNNLLANAGHDLGDPGFDKVYGWGVTDSKTLLDASYKDRPVNLYKGSYADVYLKWMWAIGIILIVLL